MLRSADDIVALYSDRRRSLGPVHAQMCRVREMSNGDLVIPVSELDQIASNGAANLLILGLEQMSMRVGSTLPSPYFPPLRASLSAKAKARSQRDALLSIWDRNKMGMKLRSRARYLLGYSNGSADSSRDPTIDGSRNRSGAWSSSTRSSQATGSRCHADNSAC